MGSGTRRVTRTISMKRGENNVDTVSDTGAGWVGRLNSAGRSRVFAIASENSPVLEMSFRSRAVN